MRIDEAAIGDGLSEFRRTRAYVAAEKDLSLSALCLVGPPRPVVDWNGGNAMRWPVGLRVHKEPAKAGQRDASSRWEDYKTTTGESAGRPVVTLRYVWVRTEVHAARLKTALQTRLIGADAVMRELNGNWVDLPEWAVVWDLLLADAIRDIEAGGEQIETWDDESRHRLILWHARSKGRVRS